MAMALTLQKYLADHGIAYDLLPHTYTTTSMNTAHTSHISGENLAKSVILEDDAGYLMAVIPATEHIKFRKVNHALKRHMGMAIEPELESLFFDCDLGAIPAVGDAYFMESIVDSKLDNCADIYIESGDHEELVHLKGTDFQRLMKNSQHINIC